MGEDDYWGGDSYGNDDWWSGDIYGSPDGPDDGQTQPYDLGDVSSNSSSGDDYDGGTGYESFWENFWGGGPDDDTAFSSMNDNDDGSAFGSWWDDFTSDLGGALSNVSQQLIKKGGGLATNAINGIGGGSSGGSSGGGSSQSNTSTKTATEKITELLAKPTTLIVIGVLVVGGIIAVKKFSK